MEEKSNQELKRKVMRIIGNMKEPQEIKEKIRGLYREYENACSKCERALNRLRKFR